MAKIKGTLRLFFACLLVMIGLLACCVSPIMSRRVFFWLANIWHSLLLYIIGIRVRCQGAELVPGSLMIGNHISWADIMVVGAHWPVVFLAKRELANWPILGWIIRGAGTLFIERGKGASKALQEIGNTLHSGQSVLVFPEGKTSSGESVNRFQPRLLQAAIDAGCPIQTFSLGYADADGQRVDRMSYIGDVSFMGSFWRTVCGPLIYSNLTLAHAEYSKADRQQIALAAEEWVKDQI